MTNDWNSENGARRRRKLFLSQIAGASDNAEGVGARLILPFPFSVPFPAAKSYLATTGLRIALPHQVR